VSPPRLVVIGGGLAGIAAALRLAEAGERPLLIETRRKLGGRATSFVDPRNDLELDNCQHVVLGCCTNLLDLYERLGVLELIEWHEQLHWTAGKGVIDTVKPGWLPAPFHLAGSFRRLKFLDKSDRRAIERAMWRMIRMGGKGRRGWFGRPFSSFLEECHQPNGAVERFWNVVIVSACNLDVARVDAGYAIQVFQEGFLANRFGYAMGLPTVPLRRLYDPAVDIIEREGGDVVEGISAKSISYDGKRVTGVVTPDGVIRASAVVAAVPFDRLDKLASDTLKRADSRLQQLNRLHASPILGVHLWFDTEIMALAHLVVVGGGVQWLFNKGTDERGRQHVHAVVSAADEWMPLDEREIVERVMEDVHRVLPAAKGIAPAEARSVKEKRATFAAVPGVDQWRPRAAPGPIGLGGGGVRNLYLAGDWCDTGWPATMEGAVRSGYAAAEAVTGAPCTVGDLPPGAVARLLGLKSGARTTG